MNTTLSASPTGSPSPTRSLPEPWIIRLKAVVPELICVAIILNRKLVPSTHFSRTIAPRGRPIAQMDGVFLATADATMNQQNSGMYQSDNNNQANTAVTEPLTSANINVPNPGMGIPRARAQYSSSSNI